MCGYACRWLASRLKAYALVPDVRRISCNYLRASNRDRACDADYRCLGGHRHRAGARFRIERPSRGPGGATRRSPQSLAGEIVAAGGAAPIVIACDLEQPDAGDKIAAALAAEGVEVEYVVNNAGFGIFGRAIERDRAEQLGMIDRQHPRADRSVAALFRSADPPPRRHSQCRFDRRLSAGTGHGGLLRVQGLCAVLQRGVARANSRRSVCA